MITFPEAPDFYLSERALEAAQSVGTVALEYDPAGLQGVLDYVEVQTGRRLGAPLANTSFVLMKGDANPFKNEPHYFEAPLEYQLVPSDQIATGGPEPIAKQDLAEGRRHVLELRPGRFWGDIAPYVAKAVLGPPPEDQAMTAGLVAWGRQLRDTFTLTEGKKRSIQEEVARRFSGAVILKRPTD